MSRAGSPPAARRVALVKPKNDIYVGLLSIALGAMLCGCLLLALEMNRYEWKTTPPGGGGAAGAPKAPAAAPAAPAAPGAPTAPAAAPPAGATQ